MPKKKWLDGPSCVKHADGDYSFHVFPDLIKYGGSTAKGVILSSIFMRWSYGLHCILSPAKVSGEVIGVWKDRSMQEYMAELCGDGKLSVYKFDPFHIRDLLSREHDYPYENTKCSWCNIPCNLIHSHHFPIGKQYGGTLTVDICTKCHMEYHHFERRIHYQPTDTTIQAFVELKGLLEEEYGECPRV